MDKKYYFVKLEIKLITDDEVRELSDSLIDDLDYFQVAAEGRTSTKNVSIDGNSYFLVGDAFDDLRTELNSIDKTFKSISSDQEYIEELKNIITDILQNVLKMDRAPLTNKELLYIINAVELLNDNWNSTSFDATKNALKMLEIIYTSSNGKYLYNKFTIDKIISKYFGDINFVYPEYINSKPDLKNYIIRALRALMYDEYVKVVMTEDMYTEEEFKDEYLTNHLLIPASIHEDNIIEELSYRFGIDKDDIIILK